MKTVKMRNVTIGDGIPKICVPVVGRNEQEMCEALERVKACEKLPDLLELRADWLGDNISPDTVIKMAEKIRRELPDMAVLLTFRTAREGGEHQFDYEAYRSFLVKVAESGFVDAVDVEAFSYMGGAQKNLPEQETDETALREFVEAIHQTGCVVVGSNHDFHATPAEEEIVRRLYAMRDMGMDVAKIALMPQSVQDVLTLLSATAKVSADADMCPVITMSMSGTGLISRLSGEVFGSAITFASVGKASAPGQIELGKLQSVLQIVHESR